MGLDRASIVPLSKNEEMDFIARLLATMAGLWVTTHVVSSISIDSSSASETVIVLAVVALVFTAVNSIIKPIVTTLAFPLYLLTFGLFALVTNSPVRADGLAVHVARVPHDDGWLLVVSGGCDHHLRGVCACLGHSAG